MEQATYNAQGSGFKQESQQSFLNRICDQLGNQVQIQNEIGRNIQEKLHGILDKREPEKVSEVENIPNSDTDFSSQMRRYISKSESNTILLERILKHLSEII